MPDRRKDRGPKRPKTATKGRRPARLAATRAGEAKAKAPTRPAALKTAFRRFALPEALLRGAEEAGYLELTPLQERMVPAALEGRNVYARVHDGTGKTCAYLMPSLARIQRAGAAQVLVLVADAKAAEDASKEALRLGRFQPLVKVACLDGRRRPAAEASDLAVGPTVVVGLPERVEGLVESGALLLDTTSVVVFDDVDGIASGTSRSALDAIMSRVGQRRQTLMLTSDASPEAEVLAARYAADAVLIEAAAAPRGGAPLETFYAVESSARLAALEALVTSETRPRGVVFVRNRLVAERVLERLVAHGGRHLHSGVPEAKRARIVKDFMADRFPWLIASDAAGRELVLPRAGLVINYDVPEVSGDYAKRLSWVASMGLAGRMITLVIAEQAPLLAALGPRASRVVPLPGFEPRPAEALRLRAAKPEAPRDRWAPQWAGTRGRRR